MYRKELTLYQMTLFGQGQVKSICRRQSKRNTKTEVCFEKGRKHCEKMLLHHSLLIFAFIYELRLNILVHGLMNACFINFRLDHI